MAHYTLHDDISFCRLEGGLVFLDVRRDQYFRLSSELERAFVNHLESDGRTTTDVSELLDRNILKLAAASTERLPAAAVDIPSRSAFESFPVEKNLRATELLEVFVIVCSTRIQLRMRALKDILVSLVAYRRSGALRHPFAYTKSSIQRLLDATSVFRRAPLRSPRNELPSRFSCVDEVSRPTWPACSCRLRGYKRSVLRTLLATGWNSLVQRLDRKRRYRPRPDDR